MVSCPVPLSPDRVPLPAAGGCRCRPVCVPGRARPCSQRGAFGERRRSQAAPRAGEEVRGVFGVFRGGEMGNSGFILVFFGGGGGGEPPQPAAGVAPQGDRLWGSDPLPRAETPSKCRG